MINGSKGIIEHAGYLVVEGAFTNNHIIKNIGSSRIKVLRDFTNNLLFIPGNSLVNLFGASQTIGGADTIFFHDLEITGTDVKYLNSNVKVTNKLNLNDLEMSTREHSLTITNSDVGAIARTEGFVSSTGDGALYRITNVSQNYLFPVGSSRQPARYRPIFVQPKDKQQNVFGVRFANVNASDEGFGIQYLDDNLKYVNARYYHRIYHKSGTSLANLIFLPLPQDGKSMQFLIGILNGKMLMIK